MHRVLCLLALSTSAATAVSSQVAVPLRITVTAVCEVAHAGPTTLILHCTRDHHPADPRTLPELAGRLPAGQWLLQGSQPAPGGGTLNTYHLVPGSEGTTQIDFY
ncbi:hypothetical protein [Deinococcus sedimenti]|uniref:Uncharacterized protein n=1 Tax=Deinococcus sedimenti TaxID=1867090 RepID=A0ABQ2S1F0_9DEIO|nr:hypothetical protein [Deinococcus sedimenti]GGR84068.1 hypothetical protein GCM10008960_08880 [Deinococcus sedimenti]